MTRELQSDEASERDEDAGFRWVRCPHCGDRVVVRADAERDDDEPPRSAPFEEPDDARDDEEWRARRRLEVSHASK